MQWTFNRWRWLAACVCLSVCLLYCTISYWSVSCFVSRLPRPRLTFVARPQTASVVAVFYVMSETLGGIVSKRLNISNYFTASCCQDYKRLHASASIATKVTSFIMQWRTEGNETSGPHLIPRWPPQTAAARNAPEAKKRIFDFDVRQSWKIPSTAMLAGNIRNITNITPQHNRQIGLCSVLRPLQQDRLELLYYCIVCSYLYFCIVFLYFLNFCLCTFYVRFHFK